MTTNKRNLELRKLERERLKKYLIRNGIEYRAVAKRCINPKPIIDSYNIKLDETQIRSLLVMIADDEMEAGIIKHYPKLRFYSGRKAFYRMTDVNAGKGIIVIGLGSKAHNMNVHCVIHEFAHHVCNPILWHHRHEVIKHNHDVRMGKITGPRAKLYARPGYHGRLFTSYMEFLIHEYRKYWLPVKHS